MRRLLGRVLKEVRGAERGSELVVFVDEDGRSWAMHHVRDCCENVRVEDVTGRVEDLIGSPILMAEERTSHVDSSDIYADSATWTFYDLATVKGYVQIRWLGESNGYYSEAVDFVELSA